MYISNKPDLLHSFRSRTAEAEHYGGYDSPRNDSVDSFYVISGRLLVARMRVRWLLNLSFLKAASGSRCGC